MSDLLEKKNASKNKEKDNKRKLAKDIKQHKNTVILQLIIITHAVWRLSCSDVEEVIRLEMRFNIVFNEKL